MRWSSIYHYFFGLTDEQNNIIEKTKRQRHLVMCQIKNTSNIQKILKCKNKINKHSLIPINNKKIINKNIKRERYIHIV
jgi:hypothetical protein